MQRVRWHPRRTLPQLWGVALGVACTQLARVGVLIPDPMYKMLWMGGMRIFPEAPRSLERFLGNALRTVPLLCGVRLA
jgi:hypothetical protein